LYLRFLSKFRFKRELYESFSLYNKQFDANIQDEIGKH
jgi:hypothetical protein